VVHSTHPLVGGLDDGGDGDVDISLVYFVPAPHSGSWRGRVGVGTNNYFLIVKPLHQQNALLSHVVVHGTMPLFLQLLFCFERTLFSPVAPDGAGISHTSLSKEI
jgi:hypothetical protein